MKKLCAVLALLALGAGASGGGEPATTAPPASEGERLAVTIGLTYIPDVQFAPIYVAEANGYFDEAGVDVTIQIGRAHV